ELMKVPYYAGAAKEPRESPAGKMLASARHLSEHLGEAPVLVLACIALDPGVMPSLTTGASIYPAVQNLMLAARAHGIGSCITTIHRFRDAQVKTLLGIPADVETAALIPLGYPLGKFGRPPRRPRREVPFAARRGDAIEDPGAAGAAVTSTGGFTVRAARVDDSAAIADLVRLAFSRQPRPTNPPSSALKETAATIADH